MSQTRVEGAQPAYLMAANSDSHRRTCGGSHANGVHQNVVHLGSWDHRRMCTFYFTTESVIWCTTGSGSGEIVWPSCGALQVRDHTHGHVDILHLLSFKVMQNNGLCSLTMSVPLSPITFVVALALAL